MATTMAKLDSGPIAPNLVEMTELRRLHRLLQRGGSDVTLAGPGGEAVVLQESALRALRQAVEALAQDRVVTIQHTARALTLNQVAELVDIPRYEVVRLLNKGAIHSTTIDGLERIRFEDSIVLKSERDAQRRVILQRLTEEGQAIAEAVGDFMDAGDATASPARDAAKQR